MGIEGFGRMGEKRARMEKRGGGMREEGKKRWKEEREEKREEEIKRKGRKEKEEVKRKKLFPSTFIRDGKVDFTKDLLIIDKNTDFSPASLCILYFHY